MREIFPGAYHWTAAHDPIGGHRVSSYLFTVSGVAVDPKVPDGGFDDLPAAPSAIALTSGHHGRDCAAYTERFAIPVRGLPEVAAHLDGELAVDTVAEGEAIAPGITPFHVGVLCDDEGVLLVETDGATALCVADGVTVRDGRLGFFSDELLGDDPDAVKAGLRDAYRALLQREFTHLLPAHGEPLLGDGHRALAEFVNG